jgi:hypothetical protein
MVFTEVDNTTLVFDIQILFARAREELYKIMDKEEADSHVAAFTHEINTASLMTRNVEKYELVSRLMYEKIVNDEVGLNANTEYMSNGCSDVNDVLEDCLIAVSSNSDKVWATARPIMNDHSNLAVTIQVIRPLSWIKRRLKIQPEIIRDVTFESGKASHISGTCRGFVITIDGRKLKVTTHGFG